MEQFLQRFCRICIIIVKMKFDVSTCNCLSDCCQAIYNLLLQASLHQSRDRYKFFVECSCQHCISTLDCEMLSSFVNSQTDDLTLSVDRRSCSIVLIFYIIKHAKYD